MDYASVKNNINSSEKAARQRTENGEAAFFFLSQEFPFLPLYPMVSK
jgi:hypothetical protein